MLFINLDFIHINSILIPPLFIRDFNIIPAHLPLSHPSILSERPVFKSISPPPLTGGVVPFVPELHCDLFRKLSPVQSKPR